MRVTQRVMVNNYLHNLNKNYIAMGKIQQQLATGHKVSRPSDNPFVVTRTMELNASIAANERYKQNIQEATGWTDTQEMALGQMNDILQKVRELTNQGATGSNSESDKLAITAQLKQLKENLVEVANTSYDGRYIFSGQKTTTKPFVIKDGKVEYSGSEEGLSKELAPGIVLDIGISGLDFFKEKYTDKDIFKNFESEKIDDTTYEMKFKEGLAYSEFNDLSFEVNGTLITLGNPITDIDDLNNSLTAQGVTDISFVEKDGSLVLTSNTTSFDVKFKESTDMVVKDIGVFSTIDKIIMSIEKPDDPSLVVDGKKMTTSSLLGTLDDVMENISTIRSECGAKQNRLEAMNNKNDAETFNMTELLSKTYDIDLAEVYMEAKVLESIYQASLNVGARVLQPSILDFLR